MKFRLFNHDGGTSGGTGDEKDNSNGQPPSQQEGKEKNQGSGASAEDAKRDQERKELSQLRKEKADRERAEREAEEERAKEAGEHEKLANKYKAERDRLKDRAAAADTLEQEIREILIERLPEDKRKEYEAEDVTIGELKRAVKLFGNTGGQIDRSQITSQGASKTNEGTPVRKAGEITLDYLEQLRKGGNQQAYDEARAEYHKQRKARNPFGR